VQRVVLDEVKLAQTLQRVRDRALRQAQLVLQAPQGRRFSLVRGELHDDQEVDG
jgi:hypothetical protein